MSELWRNLTAFEVALLCASAVAAIGIVLALLSPQGRDALALLGLRVADALVAWLEGRLSNAAWRTRDAAARQLRR